MNKLFSIGVLIELGLRKTLIYSTWFQNSRHHDKLSRHHGNLVPGFLLSHWLMRCQPTWFMI